MERKSIGRPPKRDGTPDYIQRVHRKSENLMKMKEKYKLTDEEFKNIKDMEVVLNFEVPEQHKIEKNAGTRALTEEERREFEKYSPLKSGPFSYSEDQQIVSNWEEFCEAHGWNHLRHKLFEYLRHEGSVYTIFHFDDRQNFVQFLAKGLLNRCLYSVYQRFRNLYVNATCKKGMFDRKEDKTILNFVDNNKDEKNKFKKLAEILNRTRDSVWRRYKMLTEGTYRKDRRSLVTNAKRERIKRGKVLKKSQEKAKNNGLRSRMKTCAQVEDSELEIDDSSEDEQVDTNRSIDIAPNLEKEKKVVSETSSDESDRFTPISNGKRKVVRCKKVPRSSVKNEIRERLKKQWQKKENNQSSRIEKHGQSKNREAGIQDNSEDDEAIGDLCDAIEASLEVKKELQCETSSDEREIWMEILNRTNEKRKQLTKQREEKENNPKNGEPGIQNSNEHDESIGNLRHKIEGSEPKIGDFEAQAKNINSESDTEPNADINEQKGVLFEKRMDLRKGIKRKSKSLADDSETEDSDKKNSWYSKIMKDSVVKVEMFSEESDDERDVTKPENWPWVRMTNARF